jgi:hypothetical protein
LVDDQIEFPRFAVFNVIPSRSLSASLPDPAGTGRINSAEAMKLISREEFSLEVILQPQGIFSLINSVFTKDLPGHRTSSQGKQAVN